MPTATPRPLPHPLPRPRRARRVLAVGALATALAGQLLAGTATAAPAPALPTATAAPASALPADTVTARPAAAPAPRPAGTLDWGPCEAPADESRFQCATVSVPVNRQRPRGPRIELALARHLATDPSRRIGSLLINPGGPGGSGVDFALSAPTSFSPGLLARFDVVGFDPRGVARSSPVLCDEDRIAAQEGLLYPEGPAAFTALRRANRALGESCRELTGSLVDHMDTASVVRDMEAVRAGLGERRISYYGVSYGTAIGQQYAARYPGRVRAMVLDSNMDHSLDRWSYQRTEAVAMEESYGQFADWCARTVDCALHGRDARAYFDELYRRADAGDLVVPGDPPQPVTTADLQSFAFAYMYDPVSWFGFAATLAALGEPLTELPEGLRLRGSAAEFPYLPVMCQDYDFHVPSYATLARYERQLARYAPVTRLNSLAWTDLTGCQNWPAKVANPPHRLRVDGTPPILLTNSRYDVATPHSWGAAAAGQIGREAVLLTYDGVGHGDYWLSPCARKAIDSYLLSLDTPRRGTHCPAVWPASPTRRLTPGDGLVNPLPELLGTGLHR